MFKSRKQFDEEVEAEVARRMSEINEQTQPRFPRHYNGHKFTKVQRFILDQLINSRKPTTTTKLNAIARNAQPYCTRTRSLDDRHPAAVHICLIKKKLKGTGAVIENIRGVGYLMNLTGTSDFAAEDYSPCSEEPSTL